MSLAKCALGGDLGADMDLGSAAGMASLDPDVALFSESNGRFVVTVAAADTDRFEALFAGLPVGRIGTVADHSNLRVALRGRVLVDVELANLRHSFKEGLAHV